MANASSTSNAVPMATASINFVNSLISTVTPGSLLAKLGIDVYNWIQRERISEDAFEKCMVLARGLAYPNAKGEVVQQQLDQSAQNLRNVARKAPLGLVLAGSLGRALAKEPDTCYLVSTVAALAHSQDTVRITDVLTDVLVSNMEGAEYFAAVQRAPTRGVVRKIVESIYLNVVNSGHGGEKLPDELSQLCPHLTDPTIFKEIVKFSRTWTKGEIMIRCNRFMADTALWIITHFHGRLVVSVSGAILYDCVLGKREAIVRIIVDDRCEHLTSTDHDAGTPLRLHISLPNLPEQIFQSLAFSHTKLPPRDITRRPLYNLNQLYGDRSIFNVQESLMILGVAKQMIRWLLSRPVHRFGLEYDTKLRLHLQVESPRVPKSNGEHPLLSMLVPRYPRILQMDTGGLHENEPIFLKSSPPAYSDWSSDFLPSGVRYDLDQRFPVISDLVSSISNRCLCADCGRRRRNVPFIPKRGCLQHAVYDTLYTWMAHAICDAAGIDSVAGKNDSANAELPGYAVVDLLTSVIQDGILHWHSWFGVVSGTAAGLSIVQQRDKLHIDRASVGLSLSAIQHGSYILVAAWSDISKPSVLANTFGTLTYDAALCGVIDDTAFVFTEDPAPFDRGRKSAANARFESVQELALDGSRASLVSAIYRTEDQFYQRVAAVQTETQLSIVNPAASALALLRSRHVVCEHVPSLAYDPSAVRVFTFEEGLSSLDTLLELSDETPPPLVSAIMDTALKTNVLLARTSSGAAIMDVTRCCLQCALKVSASMEHLAYGVARAPVICVRSPDARLALMPH